MTWAVTGFPVGLIGTNCWIISNDEDSRGWVVDPGGDAESIIGYIKEKELSLQGVLLTHTHFDHILGLSELSAEYGNKITIIVSAEGAGNLGRNGGKLQMMMVSSFLQGFGDTYTAALENLPEATLKVFADRTISREILQGTPFTALRTPGHSADSICFSIGESGILISGDTLFAHSIGRTDLPGGDFSQITESIRTRLYTLSDTTVVYPGHGETTTIGEEKLNNPFVTP